MNKERASSVLGLGGLAALVAGFALWSSAPDRVGPGLAALGAAALVVCAAVNRREVFAFSRSRKARYGTSSLLMVVFFTAIVVIVQAIAVRNSRQLDYTRNQRFTLASQTTNVLDALSADVVVTGFFRRGSAQRVVAEDLLDLYARRSRRFTFEIVDPDRRPHIANEMNATYDELVFASGDRTRVVDTVTEETFTNALVQVTRSALKSVYFVTGHGELSTRSGDRLGYAAVREGLKNQGYVVHEMSLLDVSEVPPDCEVLVIAAPFKAYISDEIDRIDAYLHRGGSALFMLEPRTELPAVEGLLRDYGIALPAAEILEEVTVRDSDRDFGPRWTKVLRYQPHPITRGLRAATFYHSARPVQIVANENDLRFDASYLAVTAPSAWGEVDESSFKAGTATRDGNDIAGPLPVAAVVARSFDPGPGGEKIVAKVAVFGDADFVNNANYGLFGNADMFQNTVAYLAGDEDLISIRPRAGERDRVYIKASQGHLIFALCVVLLPLSVIVIGVSVFLRKRKL